MATRHLRAQVEDYHSSDSEESSYSYNQPQKVLTQANANARRSKELVKGNERSRDSGYFSAPNGSQNDSSLHSRSAKPMMNKGQLTEPWSGEDVRPIPSRFISSHRGRHLISMEGERHRARNHSDYEAATSQPRKRGMTPDDPEALDSTHFTRRLPLQERQQRYGPLKATYRPTSSQGYHGNLPFHDDTPNPFSPRNYANMPYEVERSYHVPTYSYGMHGIMLPGGMYPPNGYYPPHGHYSYPPPFSPSPPLPPFYHSPFEHHLQGMPSREERRRAIRGRRHSARSFARGAPSISSSSHSDCSVTTDDELYDTDPGYGSPRIERRRHVMFGTHWANPKDSKDLRDLVNEMVRRYVAGKGRDQGDDTLAPRSSKISKSVSDSRKEHLVVFDKLSFQNDAFLVTEGRHDSQLDIPTPKSGPTFPTLCPAKPSPVRKQSCISNEASVSETYSIELGISDATGDGAVGNKKDESTGAILEEKNSNEILNGNNTGVKDALDTALNVIKGLLLHGLLTYTLSEANITGPFSVSSFSGSQQGSVDTSGSSGTPSSTTTSTSHRPPGRKRTRNTDRSPDEGDENDNESEKDGRPKKKNDKGTPDHQPPRRLKCPFYQREPEKYTKASCRGAGFADMAKLKDHIKRVHTQPPRCVRCWMVMASDGDFDEHMQLDNICEKKPEPHDDRIRLQVLKQLDFKKPPYANAKDTEEKWKILYKVLFSGETNIPSSYEQKGMSLRLEQALSKALEEELTRELAHLLGPIMDRIKALVPAIMKRCQLELLNSPSPSASEDTTTSSMQSSRSSSDGEPWKRSEHSDSPATSTSSISSLRTTLTTPDALPAASLENPQHIAMPSSKLSGATGLRNCLSPGYNVDHSTGHNTSQYEMPMLLRSNAFNSSTRALEVSTSEYQNDLSLVPNSLFSDHVRLGNDGSFAICDAAHHSSCDLLPDSSQLPNEMLADFTWSGDVADHNVLAGLPPTDSMFIAGSQDALANWDTLMKKFDISLFSSE